MYERANERGAHKPQSRTTPLFAILARRGLTSKSRNKRVRQSNAPHDSSHVQSPGKSAGAMAVCQRPPRRVPRALDPQDSAIHPRCDAGGDTPWRWQLTLLPV